MLRETILLSILLWINSANILGEDQIAYSENVQDYSGKQASRRTQKLLACWIYIHEYLNPDIYSVEPVVEISQNQLPLFKLCLQKIKRKQAILKITSLAGKNREHTKDFEVILGQSIQSEIYLPIQLSIFDQFLIKKAEEFSLQLQQMNSKGDIPQQVEEELEKRRTYFLGFIPASIVTHSFVLVLSSLALMCCCTWGKFFKKNQEERAERRLKNSLKNQNQRTTGKGSGTRPIIFKKQ